MNRENGFDVTKHKKAIAPGDIQKMYSTGVLSNDSPKSLQHKVFFELCLHFGRQGREGLHKLRQDSFEFVTDDVNADTEYVTFNSMKKVKKIMGLTQRERKMTAGCIHPLVIQIVQLNH